MCLRVNFRTKITKSNNRTPRARRNLRWWTCKRRNSMDLWVGGGFGRGGVSGPRESRLNTFDLRYCKAHFSLNGCVILAFGFLLPLAGDWRNALERIFAMQSKLRSGGWGMWNHNDDALAIGQRMQKSTMEIFDRCTTTPLCTYLCSGLVSSPNLKCGHFSTSVTYSLINSFTSLLAELK